MNFHILLQRKVRKIILFWHYIQFAQHLRMAFLGFHTIDINGSLLRTEQTGNQIKQCTLSRSVLAQQTVDALLVQR